MDAAVATATETLRIGPMVTALARRRPHKLARETASLDRLSGGRMVLGAGLGSDRFGGEFSRFGGEEESEKVRAAMVDESLAILKHAWTGDPVHHEGEHYRIDDVRFLPRPVQETIPIWIAGFPGRQNPRRRAAAYDGFFPVNLQHPDELAEAVQAIVALREDPLDVVIPLPAGADVTPYAAAGATWWAAEFDPHTVTVDEVRGVIREGPVS